MPSGRRSSCVSCRAARGGSVIMLREMESPWEMTRPVMCKSRRDQLDSNECRHVRIQYSHTGWSLRNLGTSMVAVNHTIVAGEARLKSGDVIRLSLAGPELMFSIVADRSCPPPAQTATARRRSHMQCIIAQPRQSVFSQVCGGSHCRILVAAATAGVLGVASDGPATRS